MPVRESGRGGLLREVHNEEGKKLYLESAIRFYEKAVELFDRYVGTSPGDAKAGLAALK
jgi:hypothetical protein